MALNPATINAAFYAVLKTDSAGTAVRAALGDGANSVIHSADLNAASLPPAPFLALRIGVGGGQRYQKQTFFYTWQTYDDAGQRWYRIESLILPLMRTAYPKNIIPYATTDFLPWGQQLIDPALHLPTRSAPFTVAVRQQ